MQSVLDWLQRHPWVPAIASAYMFIQAVWSGVSPEPIFIWLLNHWPLRFSLTTPAWLQALFSQTITAVVGALLAALAVVLLTSRARLEARFKHESPYIYGGNKHMRYCIGVYNRGPAMAQNVEVHLIDITPAPRAYFRALFPYPLAPCPKGMEPRSVHDEGVRINPRREAHFFLVTFGGHQDSNKVHLRGIVVDRRMYHPSILDDESPAMEIGEEWRLTYNISAANARGLTVSFIFRATSEGGIVERV